MLAVAPLVADAWLDPARQRTLRVMLDPTLVRARADQQGLPDSSIVAAARSSRVQRLIGTALDQDGAIRALIVAEPHGPVLATVLYQRATAPIMTCARAARTR